jgi:hypothetical protein
VTFSKHRAFLNVSREQGDDSTRTCDGDGELDDASKWPTKAVFLPHGDQHEDDTGYAQEYDQPQAQSYDC